MRHVVYGVSSIITWACWGSVGWCGQRARGTALARGARPCLVGGRRRRRGGPRPTHLAVAPCRRRVAMARARRHRVAPAGHGGGCMVPACAGLDVVVSRAHQGSARAADRWSLRNHPPPDLQRRDRDAGGDCAYAGPRSLGGAAGGITLVLRAKAAAEEQLLTQRFPEQYPRYRQRVPKLIPLGRGER